MNKKDDSERRRHRLNIRVTDDELATIRDLSAKFNLSYTELLLKGIDILRRETNSKGKGDQ